MFTFPHGAPYPASTFLPSTSSLYRRDAEVQRLDAKVVAPLSQYATICKHARDDVKGTFSARDRELTRRRHLDKVRERNPRNRQMIVSLQSQDCAAETQFES